MPAEPRRDDAAQAASPAGRRFGIELVGVSLLLPESALEHLAAAAVFPLPGAGPRVLGLTQLRGHPLVAVDADPASGRWRAPAQRHALLVIGVPPEAGALVVEAPPRPVRIGGPCPDAPRPDVDFADALSDAVHDADDG
ncbi:MAG TPA: hypothetical protein VN324_01235, partial [Quisquiliibacterium sp.]|nr:hypothetical protein [Quisquiliibacterium sp.]